MQRQQWRWNFVNETHVFRSPSTGTSYTFINFKQLHGTQIQTSHSAGGGMRITEKERERGHVSKSHQLNHIFIKRCQPLLAWLACIDTVSHRSRLAVHACSWLHRVHAPIETLQIVTQHSTFLWDHMFHCENILFTFKLSNMCVSLETF